MMKNIFAVVFLVILSGILGAQAYRTAETATHKFTYIPTLTVLEPQDSIQVPLDIPSTDGFISFWWTPGKTPSIKSKPLLLFNHFIKHSRGGELLFMVHYNTYTQPVLFLSLGNGALRLRTPSLVPFVRGQTYHVLAGWRRLPNGLTEAVIHLDGKQVAHTIGVINRRVWNDKVNAGKRDDLLVNDPTFPSRQTADGKLDHVLIITRK